MAIRLAKQNLSECVDSCRWVKKKTLLRGAERMTRTVGCTVATCGNKKKVRVRSYTRLTCVRANVTSSITLSFREWRAEIPLTATTPDGYRNNVVPYYTHRAFIWVTRDRDPAFSSSRPPHQERPAFFFPLRQQ